MKKPHPRLTTPPRLRKAAISTLANSMEIRRLARARLMDRTADILLQQGFRHHATRLANEAAALREGAQ